MTANLFGTDTVACPGHDHRQQLPQIASKTKELSTNWKLGCNFASSNLIQDVALETELNNIVIFDQQWRAVISWSNKIQLHGFSK